MNVNYYRNIFFVTVCLVIITLSGCAPEENDLVPPNAAFDAPVSNISPTNSTGPFSLSGTMDAGSTVEVDVTTSATIDSLVQDAALGTWQFNVDNLVEGENIILVSVADAVGNTRTIQMTIEVDLTAPVTTILQYPIISQPGTFTLAGTVTEYNSQVLVEVIDSIGSSTSTTVDADADIWSADFILADNVYTIVATGIDRLGNVSTTPTTQSINIDPASLAFDITIPTSLPYVFATPTTDSNVSFFGTRESGSTINVTATSGVVGSIDQSDLILWNTDVSSIAAGNTVVTFDVDDGGTVEKVLVVRDQTAPTVVEWSSAAGLDQVTVLFNESMTAVMIEPTNLILQDSIGATVNVSGVIPDTDRQFTFTTSSLTVGDTYTATLQETDFCVLLNGCTVEDGRGNSLAASYAWTFKKQ